METATWSLRVIPIVGPMQAVCYGLQGPSQALAKLMLVYDLNSAQMSLLRVALQAQILTLAGNQPLGKGKVAEAV